MIGSFQFVIWPEKIRAIVAGSKLIGSFTVGRLYITAIGAAKAGT